MVTVTVSAAGRNPPVARGLPCTVELARKQLGDANVGDVKAAIAAKFPKFYTSRQKLTLKGNKKGLDDESSLIDAGITDGSEVTVKDLGPQVGWRTVFLLEYAGPLVIHPLFYYFPEIFYRGPVQHSLLQQYLHGFIVLHFLKRELEAIFVHRFSHGTMPISNIIKNSAHYHLLCGVALAYALYSPTYSAHSPYIRGTIRDNTTFLWIGTAIWAFSELSNFYTHLILRSLRPAGTRRRAIPYGYGFSLVSCPNYMFESLAWLTIAVMSGSWVAWAFLAVAIGQMALWAIKKHKAYRKDFGKEYPRGRKALFPLIL